MLISVITMSLRSFKGELNPKNKLLSKCGGMLESNSGVGHSCVCRLVWELFKLKDLKTAM